MMMGQHQLRRVILLGVAFCLFNGIAQLLAHHWHEPSSWLDDPQLVPPRASDKKTTSTIVEHSPRNLEEITSPKKKKKKSPIVDIISTGSLHRLEYLDAQRATFATHPAVRWFRTTTELNDTDARCHLDLTVADIEAITKWCQADVPQQTEHAKQIRQKKFLPRKDSPGWLCAQKRPIDGLAALMTEEYTSDALLPDYLILIDDDSYINVELTLQFLIEYHPASDPHAISGCRHIGPIPFNFAFPIGGFGAILTRKTLQNMRKPIHCDSSLRKRDKFTQFACWRLEINNMLERQFFRDGMSVADLLFAYAKGLPFSRYREWKEGSGFCFHSDLALAYFVNYYHVAVTDGVVARRMLTDQVRMRHLGFINLDNSKENAQCAFESAKCNSTAKFCHYVTPTQMHELWMSTTTV